MISKSIQDIVQADIDALVANAVEEGNQLDFKQALVGATRDDRKEFLADVCAFANTRGGDLVFGIQENAEGRAHAIVPLAFNPDDEILRLESIIADGVEPKLFGVRATAVAHGTGRVLVLRVPRSVQGIHRNKLDERFWVRESRSKRSLDVAALADRFQGAAQRQDRLQEFLASRYAAVMTNQLPLDLRSGPKVVVHIIPALAGIEQVIDVQPVAQVTGLPVPTRPTGLDFRMTFEGPMHHSPHADGMIRAYALTHHSGVLEGVSKVEEPGQPIGAQAVEHTILQWVHDVVPVALRTLAIDMPLVVRTALVGANGAVIQDMRQHTRAGFDNTPSPIRRSVLVLPDVWLEGTGINLPAAFQASFDRLWHCAGYARSLAYEQRDTGMVWTGRL